MGGTATPVEIVRDEGRRYHSLLQRRDGVTIRLLGTGQERIGGPVGELPHDLAHLVVEDALGLAHGLWGTLAAGGMFGHATVVAGRRPPHAAARAQAVVDAAGDHLNEAEVLVRVIADLTREGLPRTAAVARTRAGERYAEPLTGDAVVARAADALLEAAAAWRSLPVGGSLHRTWRHLPEPPRRPAGDRRRTGARRRR
ncbi:hypothetical protein SK069_09580 [Patulibacter brassicae]|uniref:Uncharacterized protein n=1 Tax=Patulibacter brassicae TaxID=1705717 RepID=A0ABU4VJ72_9ACTN|nr:hypothetical protein [Patulibacter brassicae]MDX8151843.1 hypothetical protein [Patulibacter brassicae]